MLDVTIASTDLYLTTTQAVKDELGITTTSADDRISGLILRVSAWAEGVIGYPLVGVQTYRETVAAYGTRNLLLSRTPLRAVMGVFSATDTGDDLTDELGTTEFIVNRDAGMLARNDGWEWSVPYVQSLATAPTPQVGSEMQQWLIDYVAGWTYGGVDTGSANWSTERGTTSTGRTLPYDIEQAVILKVARMYAGVDQISSKSIGDLSVSYGMGQGGGGFDPALAMLRRYARTY